MDDASRLLAAVRRAARQEQFLEVVDRDEAVARFHRHLTLAPLGKESVALAQARGRVLAEDVVAAVDVPGFDRANVDGFAVCARDTAAASDAEPAELLLNPEVLTPGIEPRLPVVAGTATVIATGGMLPRGADAVLMVEHTELDEAAGTIQVSRPAAAGQLIAFAGSDMARGETVLRRGRQLAAREIGMLAAVGRGMVEVWRRPRVAVLSTGDELVPPGAVLRAGAVYDSNAAVVAAAIEELGGEPEPLGIVADDEAALERRLHEALLRADLVVLSGGTSKGAGDVAHRVVARLGAPGILVHGVALKPGKPICLAVVGTKPVVVLPGFPTSAMFTFQEFVAPVIRAFAGRPPDPAATSEAVLATRLPSERGRMEYVMVSLVAAPGEAGALVAYPTAKGSGAVTAFAQADGFFAIPALAEGVAAGTRVSVQRLGAAARPADLVVIGSHCLGLDHLLGRLEAEGLGVKTLYVGSTAGLAAAKRGECDLAGIHLLDPKSGLYNTPFLTPGSRARPRLAAHAGHRLPKGRRPLRRRRVGPSGARPGPGRRALPDGQPQRRQRHPDPDRRPARGRPSGRLFRPAEIAQRGRRRRRPGPRRLGRGDRHRRPPLRPRLPAARDGALRPGPAVGPARPAAGPTPGRAADQRARPRSLAAPRLRARDRPASGTRLA